MTADGDRPEGVRWSLVLRAAIGLLVLVPVGTRSIGLGPTLLLTGVIAGTGLGYQQVLLRRTRRQLARAQASGTFALTGSVALDGLGPELSRHAGDSMSSWAAGLVRMLNARLQVDDGRLLLVKTRGLGAGRAPFSSEARLDQVRAVSATRSQVGLMGSELGVELRDGTSITMWLGVPTDDAEALAAQLRRHLPFPDPLGPEPVPSLVVTSGPPPLRTSWALAAVMALAGLVPVLLLPAGEIDLLAAWSSGGLLFFGLLMLLRRPPTMHRRMAVAYAVAAAGLVASGIITGPLARNLGVAVVCLAIGAGLSRLRPPTR